MEVSALKHAGMAGVHGRSPLLRLQSDERLVALTRRGNHGAFETLVARYQSRLLAFCRHMLSSREDAEDVLQEVFAASYHALLADERPINVRPWLYRIARNRCLNHLRRNQPIGVDSMDIHFADHGSSAADQAHRREDFRLLIADVRQLPETQRTALLLREMDALSYEQIAEAMETTIPSVKSLLVRARIGLAEAAEARQLSCEDVRLELGEVAEGLIRRPSAPVRRHLRACERCDAFRSQLRNTNRALAAVMPVGLLLTIKKLVLVHLGLSWGAGSHAAGTTAAGGTAAAAGATGGASAGMGGSLLSAGVTALAGKAAAGLAAAALVTAGAVEVDHATSTAPHHHATAPAGTWVRPLDTAVVRAKPAEAVSNAITAADRKQPAKPKQKPAKAALLAAAASAKPVTPVVTHPAAQPAPPATTTDQPPGQTQTIVETTVLPAPAGSTQPAPAPQGSTPAGSGSAPAAPPSPSTGTPVGDPSATPPADGATPPPAGPPAP